MAKRPMFLFVVAALLVGVSFTVVANGTKETASGPAFKIGFPALATSDPTSRAMVNSLKTEVKAAGGELVTVPWDFTPEGLVTDVQNLLTMGVKGILVIPPADSVLPRISKMCDAAGAYWAISFRSIQDPAVKKLVDADPYYVGNCHENEEAAGYEVMKRLAQDGAHNVAVLGIAKGDTTGDARDVGLRKAAVEYSVKILSEQRNFAQGSDATKAVESFIASYPELDGIMIVGGGITPGILQGVLQALEEHGKAGKVKVGMIDFAAGMPEAFQKGYLNVVCGGHLIVDPMFAMAMLLNSVMGTPLSNNKISLTVHFMYLENAQEMSDYLKYVEGDLPPYDTKEIQSMMLKHFNSKVTVQSLQALAAKWSIHDVVSRHKGMVK